MSKNEQIYECTKLILFDIISSVLSHMITRIDISLGLHKQCADATLAVCSTPMKGCPLELKQSSPKLMDFRNIFFFFYCGKKMRMNRDKETQEKDSAKLELKKYKTRA